MIGRTPAIAVVGSLNMDLVTRTARQPQRGETLLGESFALFVGGKGLNQAIAAARLGAAVRMVGRLGQDDFGRRLPDVLLRLVDVLTPNETETQILTGLSIADNESAGRAAGALLARGVGATVLTLGARGALLAEAEQRIRVPGYPVRPIDTTAA